MKSIFSPRAGLIALLCGCGLFAGAAFADGVKLQGTIAQVYDGNKTLLIDSIYGGQVAVRVVPNTKIEMDNCGLFGTDKDGVFKDLKVGDFLELKLNYTQNSLPLARQIEVECYKKAY